MASWVLWSSSSGVLLGFWPDREFNTAGAGGGAFSGGMRTAEEGPASAAACEDDGCAGDGDRMGSAVAAVAAVVVGDGCDGAGEDEEGALRLN